MKTDPKNLDSQAMGAVNTTPQTLPEMTDEDVIVLARTASSENHYAAGRCVRMEFTPSNILAFVAALRVSQPPAGQQDRGETAQDIRLPPLPTPDIVSTDEDRETTVHSYSDELMEDYAQAAVELNADRPLHPSPARKAVDLLLSLGYVYGWDDAKNRVWTAPVALNGMREALIERLTFIAENGNDGVVASQTYTDAAKLLRLDGNRPPPEGGVDGWCQYIAGMIETYLTMSPAPEVREAAIAGIVQRRLHWLPAFSQGADVECKRCNGAGSVTFTPTDQGPDAQECDVDCPACKGSGAVDVNSSPLTDDRMDEVISDFVWDCPKTVLRLSGRAVEKAHGIGIPATGGAGLPTQGGESPATSGGLD